MTRALTVWQPWASLIVIGAKPFEFRKWAAPASIVGERLVIHAAVRPVVRAELLDLLARCEDDTPPVTPAIAVPFLRDVLHRFEAQHSKQKPGSNVLPLGAGLGSAELGQPVRAVELWPADSDRIDHHVFAWPMLDAKAFAAPIAAKGAQGFWPWAADIAAEVARHGR